jgi:hypothetical protein
MPALNARWYSPLRRTRRTFPKRWEDIVADPSERPRRGSAGRGVAPVGRLGRRHAQAFATLRTAPLENEPAVLGRHSYKKAVCTLAVPPVRLERTLHGAGSPANS